MQNNDLFDKKAPRPLDKDLLPVLKRFENLQSEVLENWKTELTSGMVGQRGYQDLEDMRANITKNGTFILRLKPVIGFDTEDEIAFYVDFFKTYNSISESLLRLLTTFFVIKEVFSKGPSRLSEENKKTLDTWKKENKVIIHQRVMALKILVSALNLDVLKSEDLYRFEPKLASDNDEYVASMDALVQEYEFGHLLSTKFVSGEAHFYEHPDADLVGAYWTYAKKTYSS